MRYGNDGAVIVTKDQKTDCRQMADLNVPNGDDFYYVVSYSETTGSVCFITYATLPKGWVQANSLVLYPNTGRYNKPFRYLYVKILGVSTPD